MWQWFPSCHIVLRKQVSYCYHELSYTLIWRSDPSYEHTIHIVSKGYAAMNHSIYRGKNYETGRGFEWNWEEYDIQDMETGSSHAA